MKQKTKNKKLRDYLLRGQATTELAVMGAIFMIVFGMLLRYCQIFDMKHWAQMYSFRKALHQSKVRFHTGEQGLYGAASVVAMPEVYSVNPNGIDRTPTFVSASGSTNIDIHQSRYIDDEGAPDRNSPSWIPATYYQMGNRMINDNTALVMPLMRVYKTTDLGHVTKGEGTYVLTEGVGIEIEDEDAKNYYALEQIPIERVIQITDANTRTEYESHDTPDDSTYQETSEVGYDQTFTYVFKTPAEIAEDSVNARGETTMLAEPTGVPEQMVLKFDKQYDSSRDWSTPR